MKHIRKLINRIQDGVYGCEDDHGIAFSLTVADAMEILPHLLKDLNELVDDESIWGYDGDE